jgi:hypothetical protein
VALITSPPDPDTTGAMSHVTVLTAVLPDRRTVLAATMAAWTERSPFARVPGLHHARLTVLDDVPGRRRRTPPDPSYLVFAASLDGDADELPGRLVATMGDECDELWACCLGYPGRADADAFGAYLWAHRIVSELAFATYTASVGEVQRALEVQAGLGRIVERMPTLDARSLREAVEALR